MPRGGGLAKIKITFKSVKNVTFGKVFGKKPIPATSLMKIMWKFIKKHNLMKGKSTKKDD